MVSTKCRPWTSASELPEKSVSLCLSPLSLSLSLSQHRFEDHAHRDLLNKSAVSPGACVVEASDRQESLEAVATHWSFRNVKTGEQERELNSKVSCMLGAMRRTHRQGHWYIENCSLLCRSSSHTWSLEGGVSLSAQESPGPSNRSGVEAVAGLERALVWDQVSLFVSGCTS